MQYGLYLGPFRWAVSGGHPRSGGKSSSPVSHTIHAAFLVVAFGWDGLGWAGLQQGHGKVLAIISGY